MAGRTAPTGSQAMQDGPTTRKPLDTPFSEWTVLTADDADGVRWYFHVPTAAVGSQAALREALAAHNGSLDVGHQKYHCDGTCAADLASRLAATASQEQAGPDLIAHFREWHPDHDVTQCLDVIAEQAASDHEHEWFDPSNEKVVGNGYLVCRICGKVQQPASDR